MDLKWASFALMMIIVLVLGMFIDWIVEDVTVPVSNVPKMIKTTTEIAGGPMMSLGADCVLIGRPFCIAAVGGLKQGVVRYLETVREQFSQAMVLTGNPEVSISNEAACSRQDGYI